jgi:hypothetical protein
MVGWFLEASEALAVTIIRAGTKQKPDTMNRKKLVQEVFSFSKLLSLHNFSFTLFYRAKQIVLYV